MPLVTIRGMENLIPTTWRADTTTEDTLAYAMQAVSGIAVPVATKATHPSNPNKLRNLRLALSGLAPGMWATNHLEETRHYTGWNYIAIRAIAIQAAQAKLSAVVDPEAIRYAHLSRGKRYRLLKQLAPSRRKPFADNDGDGSPDLQPLPRRHPLLQLLRRPNIEQSGASLRFAMAQQLCLTGSALVWIVRNGLGVPRELYVVPTALATPMPPSHLFPRGAYRVLPLSSFGMVSDDEWNSNGSLGSLLMTGGVLDARDVKAVRWPHPLYPSDGQSSLAAGSLQIDVAEQADRARWAAMKNSHRPGFVFSWEENSQPGEEEMDAFRVGFNADNGGSQNTGKHLVLPEGMKADRMDRPPTEMDFVNAYGQLRDACLALQGVPPIACGITEAGSYAAFYAALKQFTELTMQPTLDLIAEEWTEALGEYHDDGTGAIEIHLKAKAIEDEALLDSRKSLHISARDITINESRAMSKPPLPPVPWGDVQVGSDIAAQEQQKQQAAAQGSKPPGKPPGTPGVAAGTPADDNEPEPQDATHTGTREPQRDAAPGRQDRVAPHLLKGMGPHSFASTQIAFPRHLARPILEFGRKLPASILATEGRETEIHCTVLYGLHATSVDPVDTVLSGQPPVRLLLGKLDVFEAGTHDVLVIAVQSPDLHRLHQRLRSNLPNSNKYPHYKPHVTIAYLKPGEGKVFKGDPSFEGVSLIASEVIFSAASGERTAVKLGGPLTQKSHFSQRLEAEPELRERCEKIVKELRQEADAELPDSPYGYCPQCGVPGVETERRLDGDSICANGHTYSRRDAVRSKSGQWEESKHPRADDGKFGSGGGGRKETAERESSGKQTPEDAAADYKANGTKARAFKEWFGDWESDQENASKIVDSNGEPLPVYHGTKLEQFDEFKKGRAGGIFFTDKETAKDFTDDDDTRIIEVYLAMKNPLNLEEFDAQDTNSVYALRDKMIELGFPEKEAAKIFKVDEDDPESTLISHYLFNGKVSNFVAKHFDGIVFNDYGTHANPDVEYKSYVVFNPNQIKSTDNLGTFDPNTGHIRKHLRKSADFDEAKHPRDHGKFSSKPGTDGDADKPDAGKKQPPEAFHDRATQLVDSLADGSIAPDKAAEAVEELESQVVLHVDVIGDRYIDKANSFHGEGITGHPDAEMLWDQYGRHVTETQEEIGYAAAMVRTTLGEGDVEAAQEAVEAFEQTHKEAVTRIEGAASDLNYGLNQLAEELELPAKEACSDLDDMDRDDANEQAEVINEELAGDGNPFRVQFDEGSESWEWFIPEPEKPASKRLRRLRVKRLRVKHLRKTFDESKINRAEDGRFGDKPGQHDGTDKPAGKKPSARTEWASTVAKIDADHDAKLEAYQAQTAKIETAHVAAYRDWQRQCESMEAENGKARAEWQERKEERRTHAAKLDALHYQDIDQQAEIEQIETLKGNLTALDTSDDAAARERFSRAAEALPTTYRAAFLSAFQERSDADLASAGMPDPRRERLKVGVEKMASALTAKAEKAKQAALAVASAHEAIEALGEPEFDTDDAGAAAYDEWQHKLDAAEATLETATKLFDDALEAMEGVWEKFAQKAADARDSAIDAVLARIQSEEESDREPEELSEEQLPPEPEEPEYPPEPERPNDPPEPDEEEEEDPAKR